MHGSTPASSAVVEEYDKEQYASSRKGRRLDLTRRRPLSDVTADDCLPIQRYSHRRIHRHLFYAFFFIQPFFRWPLVLHIQNLLLQVVCCLFKHIMPIGRWLSNNLILCPSARHGCPIHTLFSRPQFVSLPLCPTSETLFSGTAGKHIVVCRSVGQLDGVRLGACMLSLASLNYWSYLSQL